MSALGRAISGQAARRRRHRPSTSPYSRSATDASGDSANRALGGQCWVSACLLVPRAPHPDNRSAGHGMREWWQRSRFYPVRGRRIIHQCQRRRAVRQCHHVRRDLIQERSFHRTCPGAAGPPLLRQRRRPLPGRYAGIALRNSNRITPQTRSARHAILCIPRCLCRTKGHVQSRRRGARANRHGVRRVTVPVVPLYSITKFCRNVRPMRT